MEARRRAPILGLRSHRPGCVHRWARRRRRRRFATSRPKMHFARSSTSSPTAARWLERGRPARDGWDRGLPAGSPHDLPDTRPHVPRVVAKQELSSSTSSFGPSRQIRESSRQFLTRRDKKNTARPQPGFAQGPVKDWRLLSSPRFVGRIRRGEPTALGNACTGAVPRPQRLAEDGRARALLRFQ
jgi:hypothetical protein